MEGRDGGGEGGRSVGGGVLEAKSINHTQKYRVFANCKITSRQSARRREMPTPEVVGSKTPF